MACYHKILNLPLLLALLLVGLARPAAAAPPPRGPAQQPPDFVYVVQPNDTLIEIALRYNLTLANIVRANRLANQNLIFPGQKLRLPGVPAKAVSLPDQPNPTHTVQPGDTLFNIANRYGVSMSNIILANNLANPNLIQVGQTLKIPLGPPPTPEPLPAPFETIELSEPAIIQGRTLVVYVTLSDPAAGLTGSFEGRPLIFTRDPNGRFWTIIAIHALARPNTYPILLTATPSGGQPVTTQTRVFVVEGPYGQENIRLDAERGELLNEDLIRLEHDKLSGLWSQVTLRPLWEGPFRYPVDANALRLTSRFGTRRSYNDSTEISFHGGTDFGGGVGVPIYAAAAGAVVLAEKLTLRGNAVLINHGLGLFSGYWHLSELAVVEGQQVQPGELLGYMGDTGLVTGPHLHWELRLTGIAVDPLQWVQQTIP